jgi:hypothetical protein
VFDTSHIHSDESDALDDKSYHLPETDASSFYDGNREVGAAGARLTCALWRIITVSLEN